MKTVAHVETDAFDKSGSPTSSSHENKKALSQFYNKKYF